MIRRTVFTLVVCLLPMLASAQEAVSSPEEILYDGLYVELDGRGIVRLPFVPDAVLKNYLAYYRFDSSSELNCEVPPDYSGMERGIKQLYTGKSYFPTFAASVQEAAPYALISDLKAVQAIYSKGSGLEVNSVRYVYRLDQFVGPSGSDFFLPRNIETQTGYTNKVPCDFFDSNWSGKWNEATLVVPQWGWWKNTTLLRASLSQDLARYDLAEGSFGGTVLMKQMNIAPLVQQLQIAGISTRPMTPDVPFLACPERCIVSGIFIGTNQGQALILPRGSEP